MASRRSFTAALTWGSPLEETDFSLFLSYDPSDMEGSHRTHDLMSHRKEPDLVIIIRSLSPVMGVEIENIKAGDGINFPKPGDNVKIHYTGTLKSNGTKFDSSVDRNKPFETQIGVGRVIKGWDEGVCKLSLGQEAKLIISSDYGYGASGAGGRIPPNADLIFEVKLLEINGKKAA